jgi:non-ribosomal peptide synthetase component F
MSESDVGIDTTPLVPSDGDCIAAPGQLRTGPPRDRSLGALFAEQVARAPDAPALTYGPVALTYQQLDRVTNSLAARLRELGVGPDRLIAILAERNVSVIVGMLATVKAGGAYLALDPAQPANRLRTIFEESTPVALLTEASVADPSGLGIPAITVVGHL